MDSRVETDVCMDSPLCPVCSSPGSMHTSLDNVCILTRVPMPTVMSTQSPLTFNLALGTGGGGLFFE